jgi:hypothetical protein
MTIKDLLTEARAIWKSRRMSLDEIAIASGVVVGDIQRYTRNKNEHRAVEPENLKKELGNILFSTIRWCDDLGFDPEECIQLAKKAQSTYQEHPTA